MNKYKVKPYNSYYHYKRKQQIKKRILVVGIILGITGVSILGYGYLDRNNKLALKDTTKAKEDFIEVAKPDLKSSYAPLAEAGDVAYHLYAPPTEVRGIYISGAQIKNIDNYIDLAEETEINTFVIDIKDDSGYLTIPTDNEHLQEMGCISQKPLAPDIEEAMNKIYKAGIYPVARIVAFKDNVVGKNYPDRVIQDKQGEVFYTPRDKQMWLNPYDKRNWDYLLEVCKEAIQLGFKEIQFDYIRFHESMKTDKVNIPPDVSKTEIISEFANTMYDELKPYGVYVSADVFGAIITSKIDAEIVGQDYAELSKSLDYISPMIYPSHYAQGSFGIEYPDLNPYGIILGAMEASEDIMKSLPREERKAKARPWLQDFTATWVKPHQQYSGIQIRQQIQAVYDAGLREWILWNAAGNYSADGLMKSE